MDPFIACSDPTRRQIILSLVSGERSFGEIADQFEISRPAVSQHLKVLREARFVSVRADAQRRIYCLCPEGFDEMEQWLAGVRRFWPERLDALEQALAEEERS